MSLLRDVRDYAYLRHHFQIQINGFAEHFNGCFPHYQLVYFYRFWLSRVINT